MRHWLVELRREQYTLRDSFAPTMPSESSVVPPMPYEDPTIDIEIEVLPLGTKNNSVVRGWIFRNWEEVIPANFSKEMLEEVSKFYWEKQAYQPGPNQQYIDFRNLEHVYEMF